MIFSKGRRILPVVVVIAGTNVAADKLETHLFVDVSHTSPAGQKPPMQDGKLNFRNNPVFMRKELEVEFHSIQ